MPRPCPGRGAGKRGIIRLERPFGRIKTVDEQLIEPQVCRQDKAVVGRRVNRMRVRPFLTLAIDAGAPVLDKGRGLAQAAIPQDPKRRDAAAGVVGHQNEPSRFVQRHVARVYATRGYLVQQVESSRFLMNGERAYSAAFAARVVADFVYGVKEPASGIDGEKRRIGALRRESQRGQPARARVEPAGINALTFARCVGADVSEVAGRGLFRASTAGRGQIQGEYSRKQ